MGPMSVLNRSLSCHLGGVGGYQFIQLPRWQPVLCQAPQLTSLDEQQGSEFP